MSKNILLLSYNPVPTPDCKTVEGSALRFWRMALTLKKNGFNKITIAVWEKNIPTVNEHEGIAITSFTSNPQELTKLMSGMDVVIFSCAMGELSRTVFDAVPKKTKIIVDAYSPVYVELLTKSLDSKGDNEWLSNYMYFADAFNYCLVRADFILIGNESQKHLYRGVLAGIGALPDHNDSRFVMLPAFVEESKKTNQKKLSANEKIEVLWFGGVYPWFDIKDLLLAFNDSSIKKIATLTVVGGSNPFYPSDNMRFNGKYIKARELAKELKLEGKTIVFKDWVEYEDRIGVFNAADIAISINSTFIENDYSFRLRVADLVGNGVPVITNGGDPLGEFLVNNKVAFKIDTSTEKSIIDGLKRVLTNRTAITEAKSYLMKKELFRELHLDGHIGKLIDALNASVRPGTRTLTSPYQEALYTTKNPTTTSTSIKLDYLNIHLVNDVPTKDLLKVTRQRIQNAGKDKLNKITRRKK